MAESLLTRTCLYFSLCLCIVILCPGICKLELFKKLKNLKKTIKTYKPKILFLTQVFQPWVQDNTNTISLFKSYSKCSKMSSTSLHILCRCLSKPRDRFVNWIGEKLSHIFSTATLTSATIFGGGFAKILRLLYVGCLPVRCTVQSTVLPQMNFSNPAKFLN